MLEGYLVPGHRKNPVPALGDDFLPFNAGGMLRDSDFPSLAWTDLTRFDVFRRAPDVRVQFISPETLKSSNVTWSNANLWITSHTVPLSNIWYYSAMALYRARRLSAVGALGLELPTISPDDVLYIPSSADRHVDSSWEREFTRVTQ